jgi:uncharacterized membrane protein YdbT with pleckstrin-like domain
MTVAPIVEPTIWKVRISPLADLYFWILAIAIAIVLALVYPPGAAVPIIVMIGWTLWRLLTSWELTSERLIRRTGLLVRHREEVELFRIRDFELRRPLQWMILGLGIIRIATRDMTAPEMIIGPISDPEARLDALRRAAMERQEKVRFREIETT